MHVKVTQRGGYAGVEVTLADVDTARLQAEARRKIEEEVKAAISAGGRARATGADLLEYKLEVEDQGRRSEVTWSDDGGTAAATARNLVARLQQVQ